MTVAKVLAGIVIGLCIPVISASSSNVATEAQSPLSSATPSSAGGGANPALDLRIIFYGYPQIGVSRAGTAEIHETGISNLRDISFSPIGGELSPNGRVIAYDNCSAVKCGIYLAEVDGRNAQLVIPLTEALLQNALTLNEFVSDVQSQRAGSYLRPYLRRPQLQRTAGRLNVHPRR